MDGYDAHVTVADALAATPYYQTGRPFGWQGGWTIEGPGEMPQSADVRSRRRSSIAKRLERQFAQRVYSVA